MFMLWASACDIVRVPYASLRDWRRPPSFPMIVEVSVQASFSNATRQRSLLASYGSQIVEVTSSNSFSEHSSTLSLGEYLERRPSAARSNESLYLFGPNDWLKERYETPECDFCLDATVSFGVGRANSGVSFHTHGSGFAEVIHGRKRWLFYREQQPDFDPDLPTHSFAKKADLEYVAGPGELVFFPARD